MLFHKIIFIIYFFILKIIYEVLYYLFLKINYFFPPVNLKLINKIK